LILVNIDQIVDITEYDDGVKIVLAVARGKDLYPRTIKTSLSLVQIETELANLGATVGK
jgi:hypothetical protein